jgi:hypothetical protein
MLSKLCRQQAPSTFGNHEWMLSSHIRGLDNYDAEGSYEGP